jgi:hypothetical protein
MECLAWLVIFEVCFFLGVGWCFGIVSVHGLLECGVRGLPVFEGSSDGSGELHRSSGVEVMLPTALILSESCLPSLLSLIILLLVTLVLQLLHRQSLVLGSSFLPLLLLSSSLVVR